MAYLDAVWERAMTVQEVMMKALSGESPLVSSRRYSGLVAAMQLYRTRYTGFNVRHCHQIARREHGVTVSYSFLKQALQAAGLVKQHRARGRHRRGAEMFPGSCRSKLRRISDLTLREARRVE